MLHAHLPFPKLARALRCLDGDLLALGAWPALAQHKAACLTSWFARAEHGGFYQAVAIGPYEQHGLDVTAKTGGPQINGIQRDNPRMDGAQSAVAVLRMKAPKVFDGGDAARLGEGVTIEARWKTTSDYKVRAGLLEPETNGRRRSPRSSPETCG